MNTNESTQQGERKKKRDEPSERKQRDLDEALEETFPASDVPNLTPESEEEEEDRGKKPAPRQPAEKHRQ